MPLTIRILGSGTSSGVPRIGGDWGACDPEEPKNRRTRASMLVFTETTRILIDTSPDMRAQLLAAKVTDLDAVIWTHDHADHCHGIDDLRQLMHLRGGAPVRGLARPETVAQLTHRFPYVFAGAEGYRPTATIEPLLDRMMIGDISVTVVDQPHGGITSAGLRFEHAGCSIGYATDFSGFTPEMAKLYAMLDVWVVDALRRAPHPTHPNLDLTLGHIKQCAAGRAVLMHMDQSMDYATLLHELPSGIEPGYDGMEVTT